MTTSAYFFQSKFGKQCSKTLSDIAVKMLYFELTEDYKECIKLKKEINAEIVKMSITPTEGEFNQTELYDIICKEYNRLLYAKRALYQEKSHLIKITL